MEFSWQYPIYLLPHDRGYASLVDANDHEPTQSLIICTELQAAIELMAQFAMLGAPRALRNDREFRWLLQSLRKPVTQVAFDPAPTDDTTNARWQVSVTELLARHLPSDHSPWNYPVFAIGQASGFACIDEAADDNSALRAIGIFTSKEKAETYLREAEELGDVLELPDLESATTFFAALQTEVAAVALDPRVVEGRRAAEYCLAIDVLLSKYLVREA